MCGLSLQAFGHCRTNLFLGRWGRHSPQREGIKGRGIPLRRVSWSRLSLPYCWRSHLMTSPQRSGVGPCGLSSPVAQYAAIWICGSSGGTPTEGSSRQGAGQASYSRGGVCGEVCCNSRRKESWVGVGVLVQGGLASLVQWALSWSTSSLFRRVHEGMSWSWRWCFWVLPNLPG